MSATANSSTAMRPKEFHFPLSVEWTGGRRVAARVAGKPVIEITPPPVFRRTDPSAWSPEDFLVAAAASCLAVTFTGLAARAGLSYTTLEVEADGVAGSRDDRRFGFTRLLLRLHVETEEAEEARRLAKQAEATCLVSASLDLPVETLIEVPPPASDRTNTRDEVQLLRGRAPGSLEAARHLPFTRPSLRRQLPTSSTERRTVRRALTVVLQA